MNLIITHNEYFITINNYEADLLGINSKKGKRYKTARLFHILNCILDLAGIIHMNKQYKLKIQKSKDGYGISIFSKRSSASSFAVKFSSENELLTLTEQLYKNGCSKLCVSSIYVYNEKYYLVITPITKSLKTEMICDEFSLDIIRDYIEILKIQQNGLGVCSTNAIDKLGETISG